MRHSLTALAVVGLLFAPFQSAQGQVTEVLAAEGTGGSVTLVKPLFDDLWGSDFSATTAILRGTFYTEVGERASLLVRVPVVHAGIDGSSSTTLGSPEVGLAFRSEEGEHLGYLTVVVPIAQEFGDDDFATGVGMMADYLHGERYVSEVVSVNGMFTPRMEMEGGGILGFKAGASAWFPRGDNEGDTELLARYGAYFTYAGASARFGAELNGFALISESDLSFNERTVHEAAVSVGMASGEVLPELIVSIPLDKDVREVLNANVGIRLRF